MGQGVKKFSEFWEMGEKRLREFGEQVF